MSQKDDEIRRLRRLRERQLQARDPQAKIKATHKRLAKHHEKTKEKLTVRTFLRDMPLRIWYSFLGLLIGALLGLMIYAIADANLTPANWVKYLAIFLALFGFVVGRVVGAAMEWRSDGWVDRR